jgi:hypothetical protein
MTGIEKGENIWGENRGEDLYLSGGTNADLDFIAHERQDIPRLLEEIERLNKVIEKNERNTFQFTDNQFINRLYCSKSYGQ